jgi:hypothetical protein
LGLEVVRYWNDDVLLHTDEVMEDLLSRLLAPHPDPLPAHGERESIARQRAHRRARHRP